jgi:phage tail sheath protein FI
VYEIPSGVHTITGVATSITAFLGVANRGPVDRAVHIFSFRDYERAFGGLDGSALSYAVSQFFLNGGSEAYVVRLAKGATFAHKTLQDTAGHDVLTVKALDEGDAGNHIQVSVDQQDIIDKNNFNTTFSYVSQDNPTDNRTETFKNLSMDPSNPRFVEDMINGVSQLVTVTEVKPSTTTGSSSSSSSSSSNTGSSSSSSSGSTTAVVPSGSQPPAQKFPNIPRPVAPSSGSITSGEFTNNDLGTEAQPGPLRTLPDATHNSFKIGFDDHDATDVVTIDSSKPGDSTSLSAYLKDIALRIQIAVQSMKPALPAWRGFTCTSDGTHLILTSGTSGQNSAVKVANTDGSTNSIFTALHLNNATTTAGLLPTLASGEGHSFETDGPNADPDALTIYTGDPVRRTGIQALEAVDLFNLLCLPGVTHAGILTMALQYCQSRRAVLIVDAPIDRTTDPPQSLKPDAMVEKITGPTLLPKADLGTYAAIYYPWVKVPDPLNGGKLRSFPPSGMIAGLYARTDTNRGVWKAPAGTEATLIGVQGIDYPLTNMENGPLNGHGVNCLRIFPVYGPICWGARTVSGDDQIASEYKYVPIRRTALYIEESLYRGLQWVVFEPNDEPLWAQIRLNVGAFMHDLFVKGAFQGTTPKDAYFVKCDKETNPQNQIDLGIVNIVVGFAPLKPAEFVIINIQQMAGQIQV